MTHSGVLRVTANGTNTSPVTRGTWVLDRILGTPPRRRPRMCPPLNRTSAAPKRSATSWPSTGKSPAAPLAMPRSIPPAMPWRTSTSSAAGANTIAWCPARATPRSRSRPATAWLPSARGRLSRLPMCFPGAASSRTSTSSKGLFSKTPSRSRGLTQRLLVYATGHAIEFADRPAVDTIVADLRSHAYGFRSLIHAIVQSPTFRSK